MEIAMNQYFNPSFNIAIDFPEHWTFRYWGNRGNQTPAPSWQQLAFDDYPTDLIKEKQLFLALSRNKKHSLLGSAVSIISLYRPNGFSLTSECGERHESDLQREFQKHIYEGEEIQSLYLEQDAGTFTSYINSYCWQHGKNLWLLCQCRSDNNEDFNEAKSLLGQLELLKLLTTLSND